MERKNANKSIAIITKKYNIKNRKGETVAYTIISQNNTTTTLSDENGNVITVPARVTLATSTDYTIKKVNNNSVDLEDGDGKIIRGVPACVVLAGEGGGGGGSVDYAKTVQRAETMPTANASNAGQQFLYSGESDATYTHGYIYENVTSTTPASATIAQTTGSTLSDLTVDGETFWEELEEYEIPQQTGDYAFTYNGETGYWDYGDDYFDLSDFGVTYTGTPADSDVLTISVTAPSATYAWTRVDVQPAGATYTAGNGISIDANNEISVTNSVLVNQRPTSGIWANGQDTGTNVIIGPGTTSSTVASFYNNRVVIGANADSGDNPNNVVIGANAKGRQDTVTVGSGAVVNGYYSIGVGLRATVTAQRAIAVGYRAGATATGAIQLGSVSAGTGTNNSDADTFKVANANGNFEIMSADGTIPAARHASLPATDGTYVLKLVIASGVPTLSWVAE